MDKSHCCGEVLNSAADAILTQSAQSIAHAADRGTMSFHAITKPWLGTYFPLSVGVFTVRESFCWLTDRVHTVELAVLLECLQFGSVLEHNR